MATGLGLCERGVIFIRLLYRFDRVFAAAGLKIYVDLYFAGVRVDGLAFGVFDSDLTPGSDWDRYF